MVFNSPCLTDNKELIHHEGTALFNKATKIANYMVLEGVLMKNKDAASSRDIQLICAEFSSIQVKTQAYWMLYVVPTGRVVVPTGRYVVPAGKVIIIVSPGRLSLVPTGRVLSPGKITQALSDVESYQLLKREELTDDESFLLQAYFLLYDYIMDGSHYRRGQSYWFSLPSLEVDMLPHVSAFYKRRSLWKEIKVPESCGGVTGFALEIYGSGEDAQPSIMLLTLGLVIQWNEWNSLPHHQP
ncbi:ribonuclease H-like domain-containing protein [Tanacetum coccineum]